MSEKPSQSTSLLDFLSNLVEVLKDMKDEEKLPALIIILLVISLTNLVLNINNEKILYLYLIVVLLSFCYIFFLLFKAHKFQEQARGLQGLKDDNETLKQKNEEYKKTLQQNNTDMEKKINSTKEKIIKSNNNMLDYLDNIENKINNIKTNVDALLSKGNISKQDANEIGNQLTYIIKDIHSKKREFKNLNHRMSSAQNTFNTAEAAADMIGKRLSEFTNNDSNSI